MQRIIVFILIGILSQVPVTGQPLPLFSTPHGIFIQIHDAGLAYHSFEVKRATRGKFRSLGTLAPPSSEAELEKRYQAVKDLFPQTLHDEEKSLTVLWQYISRNQPPDSLAIFRLPAIQIVLGLAYLDQTVKPGQSYSYMLAGDRGEVHAQDQIVFHPHTFLHEPIRPLSGSRDAPLPKAEWITSFVQGMTDYQVFRRSPDQQEFQQIFPLRQKRLSQDTLFMVMTDTTVAFDGIFEYYVIPVDPFGNKGKPSRPLRAGNLSTRTQPVIYRFQAKTSTQLKALNLSWIMTYQERVRSLRLYRSRNHASGFSFITELSPADTSYTDPIDDPMEGYYYYLEINDLSGKQLRSTKIFGIYKGEQPAEAPVRLVATSTSKGIQLHWQGKGTDVRGYYVYRADGYRGNLDQISSFISGKDSTSFLDTSSLAGDKVYSYAVTAESNSYILSEFSGRVSIRPQVATQISAPLHIQTQGRDGYIRISWDHLAAREPYLKGYFLFRRQDSAQDFQLLNRELISGRHNYFYDSTANPGISYTYSVQAVDAFGATSNLSRTTTIDAPLPELPRDLKLVRQPDGIEVGWNAAGARHIDRYQLYRAENRGPSQRIAALRSTSRNFRDTTAKPKGLYVYRVVFIGKSGKELGRTESVAIRY